MKLQDFISQHKEEFETFEPQTDIWQSLEKRLVAEQKTKSFFQFTHIKWVAGITFALFVGYYLGQKKDYFHATTNEQTSLPPMYAQQVASYSSLIQTRRTNLGALQKENPALYTEFAEEWQELERNYQSLRIALEQNPNQEAILHAMIQNLRWQADILERQLSVMHTIQTKENEGKDEMVY